MALAFAASHTQSMHKVLLGLNITGVIACIVTNVLLILTALGVIFHEPDISTVMADHVRKFYNQTFVYLKRRAGTRPLPLEEAYLFYLNNLDTLMFPD